MPQGAIVSETTDSITHIYIYIYTVYTHDIYFLI